MKEQIRMHPIDKMFIWLTAIVLSWSLLGVLAGFFLMFFYPWAWRLATGSGLCLFLGMVMGGVVDRVTKEYQKKAEEQKDS